MGDDIPDYHVMKLVGLAACPQDASPEGKGIFRIKNGGKGAARDVIEQVMKTQGNGWHILMGNTIRTILNVKL
jgi:3-deoxy-D-manno-octulosonate 8-phosphate phosphatase (KDO 8-P phosphatase)